MTWCLNELNLQLVKSDVGSHIVNAWTGTDLTARAVDAETTTMVVTGSDGDTATVIAMTMSAITVLRA